LKDAITGTVVKYSTVVYPDATVTSETTVNLIESVSSFAAAASVHVNEAVPSAPVVIVAGAANS